MPNLALDLARALIIPVLAFAANAAQAAEETVSIKVEGQAVIGTLEMPDGIANPPAVLMLHGFTASRDELGVAETEEGVFSRTARVLAENGYASLRIDFRGSGTSEGAWADTTFSGQISDAVAAVDWLKASGRIDGERMAVLGWSQGGLVASHLAAARPELDAVVLWAPVVHPIQTYSGLLGAEMVQQAFASPAETEITATLPWGPETVLKAAFYHEMVTTSPIAAVAGYPGPLLVVVGSQDTVVAPQPASGQVLLDYHDGAEKLAVFETDHVWGAFAGPAVLDELMVPTTLEWLDTHL